MSKLSTSIITASQPAAKVKLALCCAMVDMPAAYQAAEGLRCIPIPDSFWSVPTTLVDRAVCEQDPSMQQLIPYVAVSNEEQQFFCYSRGKGSEEARLHAKLSIGLGGHMDDLAPAGMTLEHWVQAEAARELHEEGGIVMVQGAPIRTIGLLRDTMPDDNAVPVGSVHLGILSTYRASKSELTSLEAGVIEHGQWLTLKELRAPETFERLENWSRIAVDHLIANSAA